MRTVVVLLVSAVLVGGAACGAPTASPGPTADPAELQQIFDGLGPGPLDAEGQLTPDGRRVQDVLLIQGALLRSHAARGNYPAKLQELVPGLIAEVPNDPQTGKGYDYVVTDRGDDYSLKATLSNGKLFEGVPHAIG
jgi:hypothetical protein